MFFSSFKPNNFVFEDEKYLIPNYSKILFAGTEFTNEYYGYMEGAIRSGLYVSNILKKM